MIHRCSFFFFLPIQISSTSSLLSCTFCKMRLCHVVIKNYNCKDWPGTLGLLRCQNAVLVVCVRACVNHHCVCVRVGFIGVFRGTMVKIMIVCNENFLNRVNDPFFSSLGTACWFYSPQIYCFIVTVYILKANRGYHNK